MHTRSNSNQFIIKPSAAMAFLKYIINKNNIDTTVTHNYNLRSRKQEFNPFHPPNINHTVVNHNYNLRSRKQQFNPLNNIDTNVNPNYNLRVRKLMFNPLNSIDTPPTVKNTYNLLKRKHSNPLNVKHTYNLRKRICIGFCDDCDCNFLSNK